MSCDWLRAGHVTRCWCRLPVAETSYSSWDPIRATRQNQDIQREVEDTAMMDIQVSRQQYTGYRGRDTVCCRATWWAGGEANL